MIPGRREPAKISFFGHFGSPNFGNEGTLVAILSRLRVLYPDREFSCICTYPQVVVARYGIEAFPISTRSVSIWDRQAGLGKRLAMAFVGLSEEVWQYVRAFRALRGTDMLIVPGTGLLTDAYGLSGWGPYGLLKWSLVAKLRGCRVLFVSVGAGPIDGAVGRVLVKSALSLADYRSYRDDASLNYLKGIGFRTKRDRVYPDLVFGLPRASLPAGGAPGERRPVVGLGLMVYAGRYSVRNPSDETYHGYLESLVIFAERLLGQDYDIKLLLGDGDTAVIQEFKDVLLGRLGSYDEARVSYQPLTSFQELLSQLDATDIVVATRFHNVLFSLLLDKPVIAISFHHKCASLMNEMGVSEYCHEINQMNADTLGRQFQELVRNAEEVRHTIKQRVEESRAALDEQYDLLFRGLSDHSRPVHVSTIST